MVSLSANRAGVANGRGKARRHSLKRVSGKAMPPVGTDSDTVPDSGTHTSLVHASQRILAEIGCDPVRPAGAFSRSSTA